MYHDWSDSSFDWESLNEAINFIYDDVYKHSFCYLSMKEKYGTVRYEYIWIPEIFRFNIRLPFKKKTRYGDFHYHFSWYQLPPLVWWTKYGWKCVFKAVLKAQKKWPHIADELMEDLASNEELVGKEIHDKYWIRCSSKEED